MKNLSEHRRAYPGAPFTTLPAAELATVSGGNIAAILLGVPFVFKSIYDLGKATGRELYHIKHSDPV